MAEPEENLPEEGRPEWLPEKFESPEALAASYSNLEREFTQTREHVKAMEENYQLLAQQIEESNQQPANVIDPQDAQAQLYQMYENDPIQTQMLLAQQAARAEREQWEKDQRTAQAPHEQAQSALVAQYATIELSKRYEDFDTEKDRISDVLKTNPRFNQQNLWIDPVTATQALDEAYRLVKADDLLSGKLPAAPAYDPAAAKRQAQTATGGNPRPDTPDEQAAAWEKIRTADVSSYSDLMSKR